MDGVKLSLKSWVHILGVLLNTKFTSEKEVGDVVQSAFAQLQLLQNAVA